MLVRVGGNRRLEESVAEEIVAEDSGGYWRRVEGSNLALLTQLLQPAHPVCMQSSGEEWTGHEFGGIQRFVCLDSGELTAKILAD